MASALPIYASKNPAGIVSTLLPRYSARRVDPSERAATLPRYAPQSRAGFGGAGASLPTYAPPSPFIDEEHTPASTEAPAPANTDPNASAGAAGLAAAGATSAALPAYRPPSQYEQDSSDLRDLYTQPVTDANGRARSGLRMAAYSAGREARQTDSPGRVVGAAAGGLISGLVNKTADEQAIDRPAQIARSGPRAARRRGAGGAAQARPGGGRGQRAQRAGRQHEAAPRNRAGEKGAVGLAT